MRWTGACIGCTIAIAFQGVWADVSQNKYKSGKSGKGYSERPNAWPRIFAQQRLASVVLESSISKSTSINTVYDPKITEAPILRRKSGSHKWDLIYERIQGQKRDAASCPPDYQLCPQSMNGGCCPNDRVCGTSSCYASDAAHASACGQSGYIACGIDDGGESHFLYILGQANYPGGCCPFNYVCGRNGCTPSAGVYATETCGVSSYLCPASLGYGCCKNGMGCGISNCYSTEIVTLALTETTTTTEAGVAQTLTSTITTVITPQSPTGIATTGASGVVPKVTSSPEAAIAKTKASKPSSGGGLTTGQLGGIIGGAVLLLIIVLVATFFIIRRLNKVKGIVEASLSSFSTPRSRRTRPKTTVTPDLDAMSIDPLIITPSDTSPSMQQISHPTQPSSIHSPHHVPEPSPPFFQSPWPPRLPPYNNYGSGYAPVATSEGSSSAGYRNPSLESTSGLHQSPVGYFDIPPRPDHRDQNLRFGHTLGRRPSKHERQWSESSDQSQISQMSQTSSGMAELEAQSGGDQRTSFQKALQGMGMGRILSRRRSSTQTINTPQRSSDPVTLTGGPTRRPEWTQNQIGLGHIPEAGESRLEIKDIPSGLSDAELRKLTLLEQQAYGSKAQQERKNAMSPDHVPGQNAQLLHDINFRS